MKDSDLRGILLQQFYDHRKKGMLGINVQGMIRPVIPEGSDEQDVLRICDQLGESGLLDWRGLRDHTGQGFGGGCGKISGAGVDVIEGEAEAPIPIHIFDQSHHQQTINITGNQTGVQVGGAMSNFEQTVIESFERIISGINASKVSDEDKREAKSKLASFLGSNAVQTILGAGVKALIDACAR